MQNYFPKTVEFGSVFHVCFQASASQAVAAYSMADRLVDACEQRRILYANSILNGELVVVLHKTPRSRKLLLEMADDW